MTAENFSFWYGEKRALHDINVSAAPRSVTALIGPSGCGKTTLLNLVGGLDRPTAGSIEVDGKNIVRFSEADLVAYRLERVGFVFQFFNLVPRLTAWENVELPVRFAGLGAKEREQRTTDLLPAVGVSEERGMPWDRRHPSWNPASKDISTEGTYRASTWMNGRSSS